MVRLSPNKVQSKYAERIRKQRRTRRGARSIVLKARQQGFSTRILAAIFLDTINNTNRSSLIIAHNSLTTERLFAIVRRFYDRLPADKKPPTRYSNRRELDFADLDSRLLVATAGSEEAGRSLTVHNLHGSEVAFWPNPKLLTGLLQAVPAEGSVYLESTANGEAGKGKLFHDLYWRGKADSGEGSGENEFESHFVAWWEHDEYEAEPPTNFTLTGDERKYIAKVAGLRLLPQEVLCRKLAWRRKKRAEPGMGAMFAQEYPATDAEAFRVSGLRFFDEFDPKIHVQERDAVEWWEPLSSYDWGFGNPCCGYVGYVDGDGGIYISDEFYGAQELPNGLWTGARLSDPEQAGKLHQLFERNNLSLRDTPLWCDPSMWAEKADTMGRKVANVRAFREEGFQVRKATNQRKFGWDNMHRYLTDGRDAWGEWPEGVSPRLTISPKCVHLIRTLPQMVTMQTKAMEETGKNQEDLDTTLEDHCADSLRYLLCARPHPSFKEQEQPEGRPEIQTRLQRMAQRQAREKQRSIWG